MLRFAGGIVGALMIAMGVLVGTWSGLLVYRGVTGAYESPRLYLMIGLFLAAPAVVFLAFGCGALWLVMRSGRGARRVT